MRTSMFKVVVTNLYRCRISPALPYLLPSDRVISATFDDFGQYLSLSLLHALCSFFETVTSYTNQTRRIRIRNEKRPETYCWGTFYSKKGVAEITRRGG